MSDEHRAGLPEDWTEGAEAARLRELLGDHAATRGWSGAREARLVARVLRSTTREDLSWRGEVRLFSDFVRDRVAGSPALKLLAASLLAHLLLGGPLLAWWAYRAVVQEREPLITFELPAEELATPAPEDLEDEPVALPDPEELFQQRVENAVRRARFDLARHGFRALGAAAGPEMGLLALRSSGLREHAWPDPKSDPESDPVRDPMGDPSSRPAGAPREPLLVAIFQAELLLDRWVLTGARSPELTSVLVRLSEGLDAAAPGTALGALAARTLDRARGYGGWQAPPDFDPRSAPLPLDAAWAELVERAFAEAGLGTLEVELTSRD